MSRSKRARPSVDRVRTPFPCSPAHCKSTPRSNSSALRVGLSVKSTKQSQRCRRVNVFNMMTTFDECTSIVAGNRIISRSAKNQCLVVPILSHSRCRIFCITEPQDLDYPNLAIALPEKDVRSAIASKMVAIDDQRQRAVKNQLG